MRDEQRKPMLVLGVGNILQQDDGIGVRAVEEIRKRTLPPEVEVIDGGTAGADLLPMIERRRKLIVIDAVCAGLAAGTLVRLTPSDVASRPAAFDSAHQIGLLEALRLAEWTAGAPETTVIFGVQPEVVDWGLSLSDPVAASLPRVVDAVLAEITDSLDGTNENESGTQRVG